MIQKSKKGIRIVYFKATEMRCHRKIESAQKLRAK